MNKVIMNGNLTKQPELRFATSDKAVAAFTIAVNEGYGDKKKTNYFNLVAWGKIGENEANYLNKGSKVLICGTLQNRSYESKDGTKKYTTEIIATEVEFLSKGRGQDQDANNNFGDQNQDYGQGNFEEDITPVNDGDMPF